MSKDLTPEDIYDDALSLAAKLEQAFEPQPVEAPLLPVLPCTPEMIPAPLRDWLIGEAHRMNCPLDYLGVTGLTMIGGLIGSKCGVQPKAFDFSYVEHPNIWGAIIAPPGSKKSPATSAVLKALKPLEEKASEQFQKLSCEARVQVEIFEHRKKHLMNMLKKNDISEIDKNKAELVQIQNEIDKSPPSMKRYRVNDATPEKLADICSDNPEGILVFQDELIGLLKSWNKQGYESARAFFLEGWNGNNSHRIDRVVRGSSVIETLCISVFGSMQPDKLRFFIAKMVSGDNDGLLQRFQMLIYPDSVPYNYVDAPADAQITNDAYRLIEKIAEADESVFSQWGADKFENRKALAVKFDDDAQVLFVDWYNTLHQKKANNDLSSFEQEHLAKYPKLMAGLALIFHIIDCASGAVRKAISKGNTQLAIQWCEYFQSHASRVYGMGNPTALATSKLSRMISNGEVADEFTPRMIVQKGWLALTDTREVKEAIEALCEANWLFDLTDYQSANQGRRSYKYGVNPAARGWYKKHKT